jgi:hypothetical protein
MSGLNYGYSYTKKAGMFKNKTVGVSYVDKSKKWIVRVYKNGTKQVTTVASFETKEAAEEFYLNWR